VSEIPQVVIDLAEKRKAAKVNKDYALSDSIRDEIVNLGWLIKDVVDGYELTKKPPFEAFAKLADLANHQELPEAIATVAVLADGWAADLESCVSGVLTHTQANVVILDLANTDDAGLKAEELKKEFNQRVFVIHVSQTLTEAGWANCHNTLLKLVTSPIYIVMDLSTKANGDFLSPIIQKVAEGFTAVGWKGALVDLADNWRSVVDKGSGEVDVLMSYLFGIKTEVAKEIGPDEKAKFYRNADMEWSLMLRAAGHKLFAIDELPLTQGRHHGYYDSPEQYRDNQSKKTYDRLLAKFRSKEEILSPRR
jgi:hypothetical protein